MSRALVASRPSECRPWRFVAHAKIPKHIRERTRKGSGKIAAAKACSSRTFSMVQRGL